MARFKYDDADRYGGTGGSNFFSLKDDGDVATVRFLYNGIDDVEGYAVHEVEIDGQRKYVNCLREYNDPMHKCPLCEKGNFQKAKLYIPLYDVDTKTVKLWERGKKFFGKVASLCSHYPNLCSHTFEIERHGKKGDTSTTYEIYETGKDDITLDDLPEAPKVLGTIVLDKTADEMRAYLETGSFDADDGQPVRRRTSTEPPRRTPSSRSEVF